MKGPYGGSLSRVPLRSLQDCDVTVDAERGEVYENQIEAVNVDRAMSKEEVMNY